MSETKMHFRTDGWHIADLKTKGEPYDDFYSKALWDSIPPATPGDVWRVLWSTGPIAGYAIGCPLCTQIHAWTSALNCSNKTHTGSCAHSGVGSCWTWTGCAEDGTLSANPSLYAVRACGWHGWLRNGVLIG